MQNISKPTKATWNLIKRKTTQPHVNDFITLNYNGNIVAPYRGARQSKIYVSDSSTIRIDALVIPEPT